MEIPLITTTIGSFPKPAYTPIRDWFDSAREKGGMNSPETTRNYQADPVSYTHLTLPTKA